MQGTGKNLVRILFISVLLTLCSPPFLLWAEENSQDEESKGEILKWDMSVKGVAVPQDTDAANELREEKQYRFGEGGGAYFGFSSSLVPWDYIDLYASYPDEAWKTIFPFYFGIEPKLNISFWVGGTVAIFDGTGNLAVREYTVNEPDFNTYGTAWYCLGNISRAWEGWMDEAIETEKLYLNQDNVGIRYFLSQVHLAGVVGGVRMKNLLKQVRAKELSIQRTYRDERYGVFYIPPTANEWENWIAELYVWINMKNWGIERHQVDFLYGREYCQYYNQLWNIQPAESLFYLEWLPVRILDQLDEIYKITLSDEPPEGPDEYVEQDKYVHIKGTSDTGEKNESDEREGNSGDNEKTPPKGS